MSCPPWADFHFRIVVGSTGIDYDPIKEAINRQKHGYSLESAVYLLQRLALPIPSPLFMTTDPFELKGEVRHGHMTMDDDGHVVFFVTTMRPGETVRVISLRRASDEEKDRYLAHAKLQGCIVQPNPVAFNVRPQ